MRGKSIVLSFIYPEIKDLLTVLEAVFLSHLLTEQVEYGIMFQIMRII